MFGDVTGTTCGSIELRTFNIFWDWDKDVNVISNTPFFVVTFDFNYKSDFGIWWILDDHINCEEWLYSDVQSITHKFEFSIRRDECN